VHRDLAHAVDAYLTAWRLNPRDARLALFAGAALEAAGRREDAAVMSSLGDDLDLAVRRAKDRSDIDTVHLPLIVPGGCEIRVGSARHAWREGELFAFDDSFEHEAWNRSDRDRVVLIFQTHHPDFRPEERAAIEYAISARERWIRERRAPS
jgi:Aspartyl/Asparaginyl beta-hydroxylase